MPRQSEPHGQPSPRRLPRLIPSRTSASRLLLMLLSYNFNGRNSNAANRTRHRPSAVLRPPDSGRKGEGRAGAGLLSHWSRWSHARSIRLQGTFLTLWVACPPTGTNRHLGERIGTTGLVKCCHPLNASGPGGRSGELGRAIYRPLPSVSYEAPARRCVQGSGSSAILLTVPTRFALLSNCADR